MVYMEILLVIIAWTVIVVTWPQGGYRQYARTVVARHLYQREKRQIPAALLRTHSSEMARRLPGFICLVCHQADRRDYECPDTPGVCLECCECHHDDSDPFDTDA